MVGLVPISRDWIDIPLGCAHFHGQPVPCGLRHGIAARPGVRFGGSFDDPPHGRHRPEPDDQFRVGARPRYRRRRSHALRRCGPTGRSACRYWSSPKHEKASPRPSANCTGRPCSSPLDSARATGWTCCSCSTISQVLARRRRRIDQPRNGHAPFLGRLCEARPPRLAGRYHRRPRDHDLPHGTFRGLRPCGARATSLGRER